MVIEAGFEHLYVFGTGSEGYAMDSERFVQVVRAFWDEAKGHRPMVGVIGLSTPQIVERLRIAYDIGFREFQVSLPSWGPLNDDEVMTFFVECLRHVPGRAVPPLQPATHEAGPERARVRPARSAEVPNLVATKNTAGGLPFAGDLLRHAPELMHFMGESTTRTARCSGRWAFWRRWAS